MFFCVCVQLGLRSGASGAIKIFAAEPARMGKFRPESVSAISGNNVAGTVLIAAYAPACLKIIIARADSSELTSVVRRVPAVATSRTSVAGVVTIGHLISHLLTEIFRMQEEYSPRLMKCIRCSLTILCSSLHSC